MDEEITHVHQYSEERVREAPLKKLQGLFGHCPNGEGGVNACQDGLGHLFSEEKGHLLVFGGSEPLPGWFGALMQ